MIRRYTEEQEYEHEYLDDEELLDQRTSRPSPGKIPATNGYSSGNHRGSSSARKVPLTAAMYPSTSFGRIQRSANGENVRPDRKQALAQARSTVGQPLSDDMQRSLGIALGTDLSSVTIHAGTESQEAARAIGANAYTEGQQIHFGAGNYDPSTNQGKHLIAHEVAHTVQQGGETAGPQAKLEISTPGDALEREADAFADAFVAGSAGPTQLSRAPGNTIARSPAASTAPAPPSAGAADGDLVVENYRFTTNPDQVRRELERVITERGRAGLMFLAYRHLRSTSNEPYTAVHGIVHAQWRKLDSELDRLLGDSSKRGRAR